MTNKKYKSLIDISLLLILLITLNSSTADEAEDINEDMCPFELTVNLTDHQKLNNGSYLYQGILIPPEKQKLYDYEFKVHGETEPASPHLRGCVCDWKPCMKLCCDRDEYFNEDKNVSKCEKMSSKMSISWNLLLEDYTGVLKQVNIFDHFTMQYGLPCENLEPLNPERDNWTLQADGILLIPSDNSQLDTLNYCYSPHFNNHSMKYELTPFSCPIPDLNDWRLILNTYGMAVSVIFLILTVVVYVGFKELRGNLRGKILICYLASLTMGYAIISFINISRLRFSLIPCSLLGFTCYFFFMAAFFWLSVLCFDIWKNFRDTNLDMSPRQNRQVFYYYSLYSWLCALLATLTAFCVERSSSVKKIYKPGINIEMCWLNTEKWSAFIYFYGPNLFILIFNFATFVHLTYRIYTVRRDLAKMTNKEKFVQENAIVVLRLFLIMGICWLFDILSYCLRNFKQFDFLFVISDFTNAIQGILIFTLFVLKQNVLNLLRNKFQKRQLIPQTPRTPSTCVTSFSRIHSRLQTPTPTPTTVPSTIW